MSPLPAFSIHRCSSVCDDNPIEYDRSSHGCTLVPVRFKFAGNGGEGRTENPLVHRSVISPVVGVYVGKEHAAGGGEGGVTVIRDGGVE